VAAARIQLVTLVRFSSRVVSMLELLHQQVAS